MENNNTNSNGGSGGSGNDSIETKKQYDHSTCQNMIWKIIVLSRGCSLTTTFHTTCCESEFIHALENTRHCKEFKNLEKLRDDYERYRVDRQSKHISLSPSERKVSMCEEELCGDVAALNYRVCMEKQLVRNLTIRNKLYYHTVFRVQQFIENWPL
jgi:hypothetical protein